MPRGGNPGAFIPTLKPTKMNKDSKDSDKQSRIKERRDELKVFSKQARALRLARESESTINDLIMELFYPDIDRDDLNTFEGWKAEGFRVKKGEKSLNLWGRPRRAKQDESEDEYQFWPLVYLFHRSQVEEMKKAAA